MLDNIKVNRDMMCPSPFGDLVIACVIAKNITPGIGKPEMKELSESKNCRCFLSCLSVSHHGDSPL